MRGRTLIGQHLGPFKIEGLIGEGATSEVYAAVDERLARPVALKVLPRHLARSSDVRRRFAAEARHASQLNHPHVVPIYEADEIDGLLYISMLRVEGSDLGRMLELKGALSVSRTARLITQAASALDAAHTTELIHRDVKPQNILVARNERGTDHVFLTDFGLTKAIGSASRHTQTGQILGTVHYMSPEQIEGGEVTHLSDVYSLGCVLYECLTGKTPFERDSDLAVLWAHVNADVPITSEITPVPHALDGVIEKALAKDPEERYQSCGELARALRAALRRRHLPAPRQRSRQPLGPYTRRVTKDDFKATGNTGSSLRRLVSTSLSLLIVAALGVGLARATGVWDQGDPTAGGGGARSRLGRGNESDESTRRLVSQPRLADKPRVGDSLGDKQGASLERERGRSAGVSLAEGYGFERSTDDLRTDPGAPILARSVTHGYNASAIDGYGDECVGGNVGCVEFSARASERFVSITIDDSSGRVVRAWIKLDLDADGSIDGQWASVCGSLDEPLRVAPGAIVRVVLQRGKCGSLDSTPTTGEVTATFFSGDPS